MDKQKIMDNLKPGEKKVFEILLKAKSELEKKGVKVTDGRTTEKSAKNQEFSTRNQAITYKTYYKTWKVL